MADTTALPNRPTFAMLAAIAGRTGDQMDSQSCIEAGERYDAMLALAAAQQPAGYALVPLVPTPEMRRAGWKAVDGTKRIDCKIGAGSSAILYDRKADGADKADAAYRAMVAAAPAFTPGDSGAQIPRYQPQGQMPTQQPVAWRVPIAGTYEFFGRREDAQRERAEYEASCGDDAEHVEPEPLGVIASPATTTGESNV